MSFFVMPSLGSDMEGATLIEWLVAPGSEVRRGDVLAVVETDKGAIEIEVFEDGVLLRHLVDVDTEVEVGTPLAELRAGSETAPAPEPSVSAASAEVAPAVLPEAVTSLPPANVGQRVSPAARRLAAQRGIDVVGLTGSGPSGAVIHADVAAAVASAEARAAGDPLASMRRAIAAAMARAKREIPHYYLGTTVDVDALLDALADFNATQAPADRMLVLAPFLRATACALRRFPEFNGHYEGDAYLASERVHTGVAIALRGGGLVAPAIHDADTLALPALMAALKDLTGRVRAGRFRASELRDPTVTVTSLGDRGVEQVYGVIYPPQVACIGFGKVVDRPWVAEDRSVTSRRTVFVSLSADHRVSDGRRGGQLLRAIGQALGKPEELFEE